MTADWATLLVERFEAAGIDYRTQPARWMEIRAQEFAWSKQREVMDALVTNRMVAVPSCHGVGKSFIASRAAGWWIDTYSDDPSEVFLVTTAPTAAQVAVVLWRYIGQLHRNAKLPGRINRSPYPSWVMTNDIIGYGRKPADYEESAFQGIHAKHTLIIVDEAAGVLPALWDQLASLASNVNARILAIGNPTDPSSYFYQICKPDSDWRVIQIDALRTPNFSDEGTLDYPLTRALMEAEGIPFATEQITQDLAEELVSPLYVEERIRSYCGFTKTSHLEYEPDELKTELVKRTNQSAMFLARVRGVFPTKASEGVIPLAWVQLAQNRWQDWADAGKTEPYGQRVVGVDVAYTGEDETCLSIRQGNICEQIVMASKQDTVETADLVQPWLDWPGALAVVDTNGVGAGVYDTLRRRRSEGSILGNPLKFVAQARTARRDQITGSYKFSNDRAAAWWRMRELLDPSRGSMIALPPDEKLTEELTAPKHKVLTGGIIQIESKDDIKKRLRRSTDRADAVIQSFWIDSAVDLAGDDGVPLETDGNTYLYDTSGWNDVIDRDLATAGWEA